MTGASAQVAIIGAGPYGLAAAHRLRSTGVDTHVFGEAMSFWQNHMPRGMQLRSSWVASNIGDRRGPLTIDAYHAEMGIPAKRPIPLETFIEYGRWYQRQAAPDLDRRKVRQIHKSNGHFDLELEDGDILHANRVIVATGLASFPARPPVFDEVPPNLASHAVDHSDLGVFSGKRVAVIGAGQSALESAAILHESGASVEVLARTPQIRWLSRSGLLHSLPGPAQMMLYAPTDVGPPGLSWVVALPELFRRLPLSMQAPLAYRSIRPAGSGWLVPRLQSVPITCGCTVTRTEPASTGITLKLSDGSQREVEHVLLATGYRVDVDRYDFLSPEIAKTIARAGTYPRLGDGFESSIPGLHFIGAASAVSFSPVQRFVAGTWFTAQALGRYFAGARGPRR